MLLVQIFAPPTKICLIKKEHSDENLQEEQLCYFILYKNDLIF